MQPFVCGAGRCFQSDGHSSAAGGGTFPNSSCVKMIEAEGVCVPLQEQEWLLLKQHWHILPNSSEPHAVALMDTWLKKSELAGSLLAPAQRKHAAKGSALRFRWMPVAADASYWLATLLST